MFNIEKKTSPSPIREPNSSELERSIFDIGSLRHHEGFHFNFDLDRVLQDIVETIKNETGYPLALVSIVLKDVQFFKAYVGLPPELAISRATDRCSSFCQFVVQSDAPFEVENAKLHPNLPQDMVERYSLAAYYGVPIHVDGLPVGSLCVADTVPRTLNSHQKKRMQALAIHASDRLQELRDELMGPSALLRTAVLPAFGETNNAMGPLCLSLESLEEKFSELQPVFRLLTEINANRLSPEEGIRALGALQSTIAEQAEVLEMIQIMKHSMTRVMQMVTNIQMALEDRSPIETDLGEALKASEILSLHMTKLVGGVVYDQPTGKISIALRKQPLLVILSAIFNLIARRENTSDFGSNSGIRVHVNKTADSVLLRFERPGVLAANWTRIATLASFLWTGPDPVKSKAEDQGLTLTLPLAVAK